MVETESAETESDKDGGPVAGKWQAEVGLPVPSPLTLAPTIMSLGVILDPSLSMEAQITKVAKLAFLQLCQIRQLTTSLLSVQCIYFKICK